MAIAGCAAPALPARCRLRRGEERGRSTRQQPPFFHVGESRSLPPRADFPPRAARRMPMATRPPGAAAPKRPVLRMSLSGGILRSRIGHPGCSRRGKHERPGRFATSIWLLPSGVWSLPEMSRGSAMSRRPVFVKARDGRSCARSCAPHLGRALAILPCGMIGADRAMGAPHGVESRDDDLDCTDYA